MAELFRWWGQLCSINCPEVLGGYFLLNPSQHFEIYLKTESGRVKAAAIAFTKMSFFLVNRATTRLSFWPLKKTVVGNSKREHPNSAVYGGEGLENAKLNSQHSMWQEDSFGRSMTLSQTSADRTPATGSTECFVVPSKGQSMCYLWLCQLAK